MDVDEANTQPKELERKVAFKPSFPSDEDDDNERPGPQVVNLSSSEGKD